MRALAVHASLLAFVPALSAGATDVELGLDVGTAYNSNLFSSPTDEVSDYSGRAGLRLRAMDEVGALTWDVRYWPTYEKYLDAADADDWDQDLSARVGWSLSPRTQLRLDGRYLDTGNVNAVFGQEGPLEPGVDTGIQFESERFRTTNATLSLDHELAPRHGTSFTLQRYDNRFDRGLAESESAVTAASGSYLYTWDRRNRVGFLVSGTEQESEFGGVEFEPTRYYNLSLRWVHAVDPTLTLSASAGPTWVQQQNRDVPSTRQIQRYFQVRASSCPRNSRGELFLGDTCERFTPQELGRFDVDPFQEVAEVARRGDVPSSGESVTYFADVNLTKTWRDFALTLSYGRDASTTSELSGVVLDTFRGYLRWTPSGRWSVTLQGSYQRREQPSSVLGEQALIRPVTLIAETVNAQAPDGQVSVYTRSVSDIAESAAFRTTTRERSLEIDDYMGSIFVNYQLGRSTRLYVQLSYQYEDIRDELDSRLFEESNWDRFYVAMGVTYTLPRFHLPF